MLGTGPVRRYAEAHGPNQAMAMRTAKIRLNESEKYGGSAIRTGRYCDFLPQPQNLEHLLLCTHRGR